MKYVYMLSDAKNISFETIKNCFVSNGYTIEDADNFYNSKVSDVIESSTFNLIF